MHNVRPKHEKHDNLAKTCKPVCQQPSIQDVNTIQINLLLIITIRTNVFVFTAIFQSCAKFAGVGIAGTKWPDTFALI